MPRLFLFRFLILGKPLAHPGFHAPAVAPEISHRVQGFKKSTKPYARKQSTPCLALLLPAVKNAPVWRGSKIIRNRGHPAAQPTAQDSAWAQRGRGGAAAGQRKKIPKETPEVNTMVAWTRASPPKPITSRHRVVFSPLYLFTGKGAPRNHARCAFVLERGATPSPATA